jgi:hypothetical protein
MLPMRSTTSRQTKTKRSDVAGPFQPFISELIRAANAVNKLMNLERAHLLQRAAGSIRHIRDLIGFSGEPAAEEGTPDDIVFCLHEMARTIEWFPPAHVSEAMLEAVETMKAGRVLLDAKREFEGGI